MLLLILFLILVVLCLYYLNKKPPKKMKLGIILNYPILELWKDELVFPNENSKQYIKNIPDHYLIYVKNTQSEHNYGLPYDLVIGYYIKTHYPNIDVNFMYPDEVSVEKFKENDLVFILIYDLIEALNMENMTEFKTTKNPYQKLKKVLKKVNNVYPPLYYQQLINSKCKYYDYLKHHNIPIVHGYCFSTSNKNENVVENIIKQISLNKWDKFITKPDGGQESIKFQIWQKANKTQIVDNITYYKNYDDLYRELKLYYNDLRKYNGIIVQKFVDGFNDKNENKKSNEATIELGTYFVGDQYIYSIIKNYCFRRPIVDGGSNNYINCQEECLKLNCDDPCTIGNAKKQCVGPDIDRLHYNRAVVLGKNVVKELPQISIGGVVLPKLLTRVDIGILAPKYTKLVERPIFVNEVEFVPSLLHNYIDIDIFELIGKQIINILKIYNKSI